MNKKLKTIFADEIRRIKKLRGNEKIRAREDLNERVDIYMIAEDFAEDYPKIYTQEKLNKIVNARNSIEASNIMTSLRRAIP